MWTCHTLLDSHRESPCEIKIVFSQLLSNFYRLLFGIWENLGIRGASRHHPFQKVSILYFVCSAATFTDSYTVSTLLFSSDSLLSRVIFSLMDYILCHITWNIIFKRRMSNIVLSSAWRVRTYYLRVINCWLSYFLSYLIHLWGTKLSRMSELGTRSRDTLYYPWRKEDPCFFVYVSEY